MNYLCIILFLFDHFLAQTRELLLHIVTFGHHLITFYLINMELD